MKFKMIFLLLSCSAMVYATSPKHPVKPSPKPTLIKQKVCPVMGGKINKKLYYEYKGHKIYVCCKGCIGTIKKDPEKYLKKVQADIARAEKAKKADKAKKQ